MEEPQHQPGPDAAPAGLSDPNQEPALLQLDQAALNRVFAELEPEALALAGSHDHSACLCQGEWQTQGGQPSPSRAAASTALCRVHVFSLRHLQQRDCPCGRLCLPGTPACCTERTTVAAALHCTLELPKQAPPASRWGSGFTCQCGNRTSLLQSCVLGTAIKFALLLCCTFKVLCSPVLTNACKCLHSQVPSDKLTLCWQGRQRVRR